MTLSVLFEGRVSPLAARFGRNSAGCWWYAPCTTPGRRARTPAVGAVVRISRPIATVLCGIAALAFYAATIEAQTRRPAGRTSGRVAAPRRTAPPRRVAPSRARTVYFRGYGYRPYLYGYYDPYLYGHYPYPYPYYGAAYASGSVRLQVKPEETEVYVDGYPAGVVDSYDGLFQRLRLPPGEHEIVLYLDGYESVRERLYLIAGEAYKIDHEMVPLAEGIPQPPRPEPPEPVERRIHRPISASQRNLRPSVCLQRISLARWPSVYSLPTPRYSSTMSSGKDSRDSTGW